MAHGPIPTASSPRVLSGPAKRPCDLQDPSAPDLTWVERRDGEHALSDQDVRMKSSPMTNSATPITT